MAGVYNFGMLTAGLPDPSQRQASTGPYDPTASQNAWLTDWQKQWDAATPVWVGGGGGVDWSNPGTQAVAMANGATTPVGGWGNGGGGHYDDSARQALEAQKAAQQAQWAAQAQMQQQNQATQQQAYNASGGGTFNGGIINASYGAPQTGLAADSSINGVMNNSNTTLPSYGGPTGATSTGAFGGAGWGTATPTGWGGPFTNKNPWAAS